MALPEQRSTWPDERLDDLNQTMREGFARTEADIRALQGRSDERFSRIDERIDSLHRTLIVGMSGLLATVIASILATILTRG